MQREIKFRVWDETEKEMTYFNPFEVLLGQTQRKVFMQATGLLDRNGKEIYEGDILHHRKDAYLKVYFAEGSASFMKEVFKAPEMGKILALGDTRHLYQKFTGDSKDEEIIGNIYENPELVIDMKTQ